MTVLTSGVHSTTELSRYQHAGTHSEAGLRTAVENKLTGKQFFNELRLYVQIITPALLMKSCSSYAAKLKPKKEHSKDQTIKQGPVQRQVTIRDARYETD